jgi:hypothetical protein
MRDSSVCVVSALLTIRAISFRRTSANVEGLIKRYRIVNEERMSGILYR